MRADRIVRAECAHPQGLSEVVFKVPRLLHEAAEGPFPVGAACVQQDTEAFRLSVRVDPLADGTRGIAAAFGQRLDQEVRERVQQHVRPAGERALALAVLRSLETSINSISMPFDALARAASSCALFVTGFQESNRRGQAFPRSFSRPHRA